MSDEEKEVVHRVRKKKEMLCFHAKSGVTQQKVLAEDKTGKAVKEDVEITHLFLSDQPSRRQGCDRVGEEASAHQRVPLKTG